MTEGASALADLLAPASHRFGLTLSDASVAALSRYAALLLQWNRRINLTGARDLETVAVEHLADALALIPHLPVAGRCVDVGSGAGLPGLVLALLRPDLEFELLEPIQKRRAFLAAAVRSMSLQNVAVSEERLDEHAAKHGAIYAFAVARAVFPLGEWLFEGRKLVAPGGRIAGLAGGQLPALDGQAAIHFYEVGAGPRTIVIVNV